MTGTVADLAGRVFDGEARAAAVGWHEFTVVAKVLLELLDKQDFVLLFAACLGRVFKNTQKAFCF